MSELIIFSLFLLRYYLDTSDAAIDERHVRGEKIKMRSAESPGTDLDELQTNPLLPPHSSSCTLGACAPVPQLCRGRGGGDDVQVLVVFKVHPHAMNLIDKAGDPRRL